MTQVTINKKKVNLEELVARAMELAPDMRMTHYLDQNAIELNPQYEAQIRFAKAWGTICTFRPKWQKLMDVDMSDAEDITNAIGALLKVWNRRAGTRALVSKYGQETASAIVGRNLQG